MLLALHASVHNLSSANCCCRFADGFSPAYAFKLLRERCKHRSDEEQQQALEDLFAALTELLRQLLQVRLCAIPAPSLIFPLFCCWPF